MTKPSWITSNYGPSYEDIVDSWGFEVMSIDQTGSYQGDYEVLLRDTDGKFGILVFGYGSCSGCDALEAASWSCHGDEDDWSEVEALRDSLLEGIEWFVSDEDALAWLTTEADGNDWWRYDDEVQDVFTRYAELIRGEAE